MTRETNRTLAKVFERPTPTDIPWDAIVTMLRGVGVEVRERPGSRVALVRDGEVMVVQRPHPMPLAVRATVRDIVAFLKTVGVKP